MACAWRLRWRVSQLQRRLDSYPLRSVILMTLAFLKHNEHCEDFSKTALLAAVNIPIVILFLIVCFIFILFLLIKFL